MDLRWGPVEQTSTIQLALGLGVHSPLLLLLTCLVCSFLLLMDRLSINFRIQGFIFILFSQMTHLFFISAPAVLLLPLPLSCLRLHKGLGHSLETVCWSSSSSEVLYLQSPLHLQQQFSLHQHTLSATSFLTHDHELPRFDVSDRCLPSQVW